MPELIEKQDTDISKEFKNLENLWKIALKKSTDDFQPEILVSEQGYITAIQESIVHISGLSKAKYYEVVEFYNKSKGMIIDIKGDLVKAIILEKVDELTTNSPVTRTRKEISVPVTEKLLGRMVDPLGNSLDGKGKIDANTFYPIEREAPALYLRGAVKDQLYTGIKAIDSMFPIGKGQRELILGDPSTGKTTIAIDTIINQKDKNIICIYVSVSQKKQSDLDVYNTLVENGAMEYTIMVCATSDEYNGLKFIAPYAGTSIAEYFLDKKKDVLIIYDDLTQHAFAYQTISLLLKRPPGREAFPGDIFYTHSRLLERACNMKDGGSITALPIVETQAGRLSSYIPTNAISITDGQLYLDKALFNINQRPAIDIGLSVSRIGAKTQIPALKDVSGELKLYYSQFLEVEIFTKIGVKVFGETVTKIERGKRLREVLKQNKHTYFKWFEQVIIFHLLNEGIFDAIPEKVLNKIIDEILEKIKSEHSDILDILKSSKILSDDFKKEISKFGSDIIKKSDEIKNLKEKEASADENKKDDKSEKEASNDEPKKSEHESKPLEDHVNSETKPTVKGEK